MILWPAIVHHSHILLTAAAPKDGEDFQEIADDFQKLIVPGQRPI